MILNTDNQQVTTKVNQQVQDGSGNSQSRKKEGNQNLHQNHPAQPLEGSVRGSGLPLTTSSPLWPSLVFSEVLPFRAKMGFITGRHSGSEMSLYNHSLWPELLSSTYLSMGDGHRGLPGGLCALLLGVWILVPNPHLVPCSLLIPWYDQITVLEHLFFQI